MRTAAVCVLLFLCGRLAAQADQVQGPSRSRLHVKVQFAGSVGMVSGSIGYSVTRRSELDLFVGLLPSSETGNLWTIAPKLTHSFWHLRFAGRLGIEPLTAGIFLAYTPGKDYSILLPNWYPKGYYWWSEAVRPSLFIGGRATYSAPGSRVKAFYYEIGTSDLRLVSYIKNVEQLSLFDIMHVAIGLRISRGKIQ